MVLARDLVRSWLVLFSSRWVNFGEVMLLLGRVGEAMRCEGLVLARGVGEAGGGDWCALAGSSLYIGCFQFPLYPLVVFGPTDCRIFVNNAILYLVSGFDHYRAFILDAFRGEGPVWPRAIRFCVGPAPKRGGVESLRFFGFLVTCRSTAGPLPCSLLTMTICLRYQLVCFPRYGGGGFSPSATPAPEGPFGF